MLARVKDIKCELASGGLAKQFLYVQVSTLQSASVCLQLLGCCKRKDKRVQARKPQAYTDVLISGGAYGKVRLQFRAKKFEFRLYIRRH